MRKIQIELKGITPLLMHSAMGMVNEEAIKKNPTNVYNAEEEAEKVEYRNKKGELFVPARCIKASILNASAWFKSGKKSLKPILAGTMIISPHEVVITDKKGKPVKDYEIDKRPVVVGRARVVRFRPRFDEWFLKFEICYNEKLIDDKAISSLRQIIEEAGQRVGLLDNRPQKSYGDNGCFELQKFIIKGA